MPKTVTVTLADGNVKQYQNVPDSVTPEDVIKQAEGAFGVRVKSIEGKVEGAVTEKPAKTSLPKEALAVADKTVRGGLLAVPELVNMAFKGVENVGRGLSNKMFGKSWSEDTSELNKSPFDVIPSFDDVLTNVKRFTGGDIRQPETTTGKYLGAAGEGVVSSLVGPFKAADLVRQAFIGGSSGLGAELGGQLSGDDNPIARMAGGLAGGFAPAAIAGTVSNAKQLVKAATKGMSDLDWSKARTLKKILEDMEMPHLASQVLGPSSTLDDVVAVAATHPNIRPRIVQATKNAPERARKVLQEWLDNNTNPNIGGRRAVLDDTQKASSNYFKGLWDKAREAYRRNVDDLVFLEDYTPQHIRAMKQKLAAAANDPELTGSTSEGGKMILKFIEDKFTDPKTGKLVTNKGFINNIYKDLNSKAFKEGYPGVPAEKIKEIMREFTPEFQPARDAMSSFITKVINPKSKSLVGDIDSMGGGFQLDKTTARDGMLKTIFPTNKAHPGEIVELGKAVGAENVSLVLREHLAMNMEDAVKLASESMMNQGPFKFVAKVAGTNAQRQNLGAALSVIAKDQGRNPMAVQRGFYKIMKGFESFKDLKIPSSVNSNELAQEAGKNLPSIMYALQSRISRTGEHIATQRTFKKIVDMLLSPDGLKKMEEIAKSPDPHTAAAYIQAVLLNTMRDNDLPEETPGN